MARKVGTTLKGISLRGNVYQARLTIPKDIRDTLGLVEFTQSLETTEQLTQLLIYHVCLI